MSEWRNGWMSRGKKPQWNNASYAVDLLTSCLRYLLLFFLSGLSVDLFFWRNHQCHGNWEIKKTITENNQLITEINTSKWWMLPYELRSVVSVCVHRSDPQKQCYCMQPHLTSYQTKYLFVLWVIFVGGINGWMVGWTTPEIRYNVLYVHECMLWWWMSVMDAVDVYFI